MYDPELMLYGQTLSVSGSGINVDIVGPIKDYGGPDLEPVTFMVSVPQATGTNPKMALTIYGEESPSAVWSSGQFTTSVSLPPISQAGQYFFTAVFNARYRQAVMHVTGDNPNFGEVIIAPVPAGRDKRW